MDKELDELFEDYDLGAEADEERYEAQAHMVRDNFESKMEKVGTKLRFGQDLIALWRYFLDADVPWTRKAIVVAALAYFISPIDAMPDFAPLVGYLDDFGVIVAVVKYMSDELKAYYPAV